MNITQNDLLALTLADAIRFDTEFNGLVAQWIKARTDLMANSGLSACYVAEFEFNLKVSVAQAETNFLKVRQSNSRLNYAEGSSDAENLI